jgi:AbiU2
MNTVMPAHTVIRAATQAFFDGNEIVRLIDILRAGNQPSIFAEVNNRKAGPTAITIQNALFTRLHIVVCRHYGRTRKGDFSARTAFELLKDPDVFNQILEVGGNSAMLGEAQLIWKVYSKDAKLQSYIHLRNKFIAHLSDEDPAIAKPVISDIFGIAETTALLFDLLARGVHCETTSFEFERAEQRKSADAFWSIWKKD